MDLSHNNIKDKLSEYTGKGSMPEEVKKHLGMCSECREELFLLNTMNKDHVPEPGGMFFETLPQRVRASVHEKKKNSLLRFMPAFALIAMVITALTAGYIYHRINMPATDELYTFSDPFLPGDYNLSALEPDDVPLITGDIKEADLYLDEDSFLREFAYLSPEEMDTLYKKLKIKDTNGGVL